MATYTRTIRGTQERLTIGTAAELGVDATAGKWATICEISGFIPFINSR